MAQSSATVSAIVALLHLTAFLASPVTTSLARTAIIQLISRGATILDRFGAKSLREFLETVLAELPTVRKGFNSAAIWFWSIAGCAAEVIHMRCAGGAFR